MAQTPGLTLRPAQRTALAPGLHTGLGVLAQPVAELWQDIERQSQENPFLVVDRPASTGLGDAELGRLPDQPTLARHLKTQIALMDLPDRTSALALYLCDDLDERGLLPAADAEIAAETRTPEEVVASARAAVQSGVGATDLADCIRLQLIDDGMAP